MTVNDWLKETTKLFIDANIDSPKLDALLLLEYQLSLSKEDIVAYPDIKLNKIDINQLNKIRTKRIDRVPLAYILGEKEFYGRVFLVDQNVLIPRPETESVIELAKEATVDVDCPAILDIGTGSGCIGITLALEIPDSNVTLTDISSAALKTAEKNAKKLDAKVEFIKSNLLKNISKKFNLITANLPYVDRSWPTSEELKYEPKTALFAGEGGLKIINSLITKATDNLIHGGHLIVEADPVQHKSIINNARQYGLKKVTIQDYAILFRYL